MAHWFHRNPIKASGAMKFDILLPTTEKPPKEAVELTRTLKTVRLKLLELLSNHNSDIGDVSVAFTEYVSLLKGFLEAPVESGGESKLRFSIHFRWTNSLGGRTPSINADAEFELFSVIMNVANWHSKHASVLAASDEIDLETAKEVHRCLKIAAGYMLYCKEHVLPKLPPTTEKGVDYDPRIVDAYANQFQAEAQEITLGRALELKHKPSVIYSLAVETSNLFTVAGDSLVTLDEAQVGKWMAYLKLKAHFYRSYILIVQGGGDNSVYRKILEWKKLANFGKQKAYCFFGQDLLAQEKCGESVKALQYSSALYAEVEKLCVRYSRTKGPGTIARPERHPFFQKLGPMVKSSLEKSTRENGFIFYQKVPEQVPDIPSGTVYGLATPEDLSLPPHNPLWTEEVYSALLDEKPTYPAAGSQEIAPIPEPDIAPGSAPKPKTESSCVIS